MSGFRLPRGFSRAQRHKSASKKSLNRAVSHAIETLEPRQLLHAGDSTPSAVQGQAPQGVIQNLAANELAIKSTTPLNGAQNVAGALAVTVTFSVAVNPLTVSASTFELRDPTNAIIPATISYDAASLTATLTPTTALPVTTGYYTAHVRGGSTGVADTIGNDLAADFNWSFTTGVPSFTQTTVFSNLQSPTAVRFAPDGRIFIAQKSGIINEFDSLTDTTPTVVADLRTEVHNFWDRGLLGLAIDPNFPTSPYIYVLYAYDADLGGTAPKWGQPGGTTDSAGPSPTTTGATISGRLSRLTISANSLIVPGSEKVLVEDWQQQFYTHSVGTVAFGPDGALYASAGEGASPEFADSGQVPNGFGDPVNEGGALRSQDLLTPNDPTTLDGTVIRVDPSTGAALPTNPNFLTGNDENARRIVSFGFRNPYRFTFRPGTNELWVGDVGWNDTEEINRITSPSTTLQNFGWPAYEGNVRQPGYQAANLPLLNSLYAAGNSAVTFPYFSYSHTQQVVAGSGEPVGGSSTSGLAFYAGGSYPTAYNGALFFTDYARQRIWVMNTGPDGLPDQASRKLFATVSGPVDLQIGPNGDLFYCDFNNGTVRRFQYFSGNRPPTAVVKSDKTEGATPLTVQFDASQSTDPDAADTLTYAWDLDGDGQFNDSTAISPTYTYPTASNVTVRVKVTDAAGLSDTAATEISVGNTAPVPTITSPTIQFKWSVGSQVSFSGGATDNEDGTIPASRLVWTLILHHDNLLNPANSHVHSIQSYVGVSSGSFVAPDHGYPSRLELFLTATDSSGLSTTTSVVLNPQTVNLNFASNPAGIQVAVNGDSFTTPFSTTVIAGSSNSISAPVPQTINGVPYNFAYWSDGGAQTHNILAGASDSSYTATYVAVGTGTDVTSGLVDRWKMDEGIGNATADSVGGNNGMLTNGPTWTTGRVGLNAVNFDGINDYVATSNDLGEVLGKNDSTLTAWIKTTQVGDDLFWQAPGLTGVEQAGGDKDMFWGWLDASGKIGIQAGDGAAAKSTAAVNDGQWHFVSFSRSATSGFLQVWVDGALNATVGGWQGERATEFKGFGRIDDTAGTPSYFKGAIDDLRVYNRVLTNAEVTSIFTVSVPNAPPSFLNPPATPVTVSGKTQNLSALGVDDSSEASLVYTWSVVGTPPAPVAFSANASNAAKNTNATFSKAGNYTLRVTIIDVGGLTATADVAVTVLPIATSVAVTPGVAPALAVGQTQQFTALVRDQFGDAITPQPAVTWVLTSGGGSLSATGLYTAGGTPGGNYSITATSGEPQGTAGGTILNTAPTIATAAAATPVAGATSALSVLGADDGGESSLIYTWAVVGTPAGPVTFSANDTNAAKSAVATFTKAGTYTLRVTLSDGSLSTTSDVAVVVSQTLTTISVTPATASTLTLNNTLQFTAAGFDQFGNVLAVQPAFIWAMAGGVGSIDTTGKYSSGSLVGTYQVSATSGAVSGTASGDVSNAPPAVAIPAAVQPNPVAGTTALLSVLGSDDGGAANLSYTWSVVGVPPGVVTFSVNGSNAAASTVATFAKAGSYTLRATMSDGALSTTSDLTFVVAQTLTTITVTPINPSAIPLGGTQSFAAIGNDQFGEALATQPTFAWSVTPGSGTIDGTGKFTAGLTAGPYLVTASSAAVSGTATGSVINTAPAIATAAAASPSPVTGTTTQLTATGSDDGGASNLSYTWSVVGTPPAPVSFSANGTNAARTVTATFSNPGSYTFRVTISDAGGLSTTSDVSVVVQQSLTSIAVTPVNPTGIPLNGTQQFSAVGSDQFGVVLPTQPVFTWNVSAGGGSIDATGKYTAGAVAGPYQITATSGAVAGGTTATVANTAPTIAIAAAASANPVTGTNTVLTASGSDDGGAANLKYTWSVVGTPPAAVTFSVNGTNAAKTSTATFTKAGSYTFRVTIADTGGLMVASDVMVVVQQTLTALAISPTAVSVAAAGTQAFAATGLDQFGASMAVAPAVTWSVDAGGSGSIVAATGLYTAGTLAGSATVRATSGSVTRTAAITVTSTDVVTSGLVDKWALDEGTSTTAADFYGPNAGTLTNGPTWVAGVVGAGALNFDGVNDYVAVPNDLAPLLGNNKTTVTAWIKTTQAGNDMMWQAPGLTGVEQANGNDDIFWGWIDAAGRIGVQAGDGPVAKSTAVINDGKWHHVAFSRDSVTGLLQTWVDGTLNASVYGWQGSRPTPINGFGRIDDTSGTPGYFKGSIDDFRVYNRVLATSEVVTLKNAATLPPNQAPTVATAAAANPATVTTTNTALSVLGADDAVESTLTYTWAATTMPTGAPAVTFSANGTNAAKATTATFGKAGTYVLRATISDGSLTTTSSVTVTVNQKLTSLVVGPATPTIVVGTTQTFTATARDQFAATMAPPSPAAWSVTSGSGTINATTGVYTAPVTGAGQSVVKATIGTVAASTTLTYTAAFAPVKINFQPATAPTVVGYIVDAGVIFGSRGNGLYYGWNTNHADVVVDRNVNTDQLLDTTLPMKSGAKWDYALPNGTYAVKISVGDATAATTNTVKIEGTAAFSGVTLAANVFQSKTITVTVTDGRLTIDNGNSANLLTRINYIEIAAG